MVTIDYEEAYNNLMRHLDEFMFKAEFIGGVWYFIEEMPPKEPTE